MKRTIQVKYDKLSLRPYPGEIYLFRDLLHLRAYYENKTGEPYTYNTEPKGGQFIRLLGKDSSETVWLVYGRKPHVLAHEFSHVLLNLFREIGSDPADGNGEPFCYMLSQLMIDAA